MQRPRPTEFRIIEETGYSFPSGHSMISMAFYGYLIYLIQHRDMMREDIIYINLLLKKIPYIVCINPLANIYMRRGYIM